jgi:uncharacterized protein (DUF1800 family)
MSSPAAFIAANRFGMGAGPNELTYLSHDPRGAVVQQLANPIAPPVFDGLPSSAEALRQAKQLQDQRKQLELAS